MSIDSIGNFLTIIRNGLMAAKPSVTVPHSQMRLELVKILKREGFIRDFSMVDLDQVRKYITIKLKYVDGESVIHEIKRISKPGRRYYAGMQDIGHVIGGLGISILTTNRGIITNKQAKQLNTGGEILCTVW